MRITRRGLLRSGAVAGVGAGVAGSAAPTAEALTPAARRTTMKRTLLKGTGAGYRTLVRGPGERHLLRVELGARPRPGRRRRRRGLLAFVQLSRHPHPRRPVPAPGRVHRPPGRRPAGQLGHLHLGVPAARDAHRADRRRDGAPDQPDPAWPGHRQAARAGDPDRRQLRQQPAQRDPLEHRRPRRPPGPGRLGRPRDVRGCRRRRPDLLRHPLLAPARHAAGQGRTTSRAGCAASPRCRACSTPPAGRSRRSVSRCRGTPRSATTTGSCRATSRPRRCSSTSSRPVS